MPMTPVDMRRAVFLEEAARLLGHPYIYGGDDPSGVDCSGLVVECLKAAGGFGLAEHDDLTAAGLWERYKYLVVTDPVPGCLQFFFDAAGNCFHVVICVDPWYVVGASGGGSATTSAEAAWKQNAFVKKRPIVVTDRTKFVNIFK